VDSNQLIISKLNKTFESTGQVLKNVSFSLEMGHRLAVIGPSGCGKSTLLRLLAGMETPDHEFLFHQEQGISNLKNLGKVSFVFQDANLLPWRNVQENVALPLELEKRAIAPQELEIAIGKVGLSDFKNHYPTQLSGGMKMRVALARALITNPDFILLDEPFGALDEFTREQMGHELMQLWQDKKPTTILITHNIEEALLLSDRVLVLADRPGMVRDCMEVHLPELRTPELKDSEIFWKMRQKLAQLLRHTH
jgi:NitT/TauT family transport system ATP-binding protein